MDFEDKAVGHFFGSPQNLESSSIVLTQNMVLSPRNITTRKKRRKRMKEHEEEVGRPFIDMSKDRLTLSASFDLDTDLINSISGSYIFSDYYHGEWEDADELGTAFDLESQETQAGKLLTALSLISLNSRIPDQHRRAYFT